MRVLVEQKSAGAVCLMKAHLAPGTQGRALAFRTPRDRQAAHRLLSHDSRPGFANAASCFPCQARPLGPFLWPSEQRCTPGTYTGSTRNPASTQSWKGQNYPQGHFTHSQQPRPLSFYL